jgi:hypothetical protein
MPPHSTIVHEPPGAARDARSSSRCDTKNWSDDWLGELREDQRAA